MWLRTLTLTVFVLQVLCLPFARQAGVIPLIVAAFALGVVFRFDQPWRVATWAVRLFHALVLLITGADLVNWLYTYASLRYWRHHTGALEGALCLIWIILLTLPARWALRSVSCIMLVCITFLFVSIPEKHCFVCESLRVPWQVFAALVATFGMLASLTPFTARVQRIGMLWTSVFAVVGVVLFPLGPLVLVSLCMLLSARGYLNPWRVSVPFA